MKRSFWRKHHKWFGLGLTFFIIMFSLSGLVLNHRSLFLDCDVSRQFLPEKYHYKSWNNGLLRGSRTILQEDSTKIVLIYGSAGLWQATAEGKSFAPYNDGLPLGADGLGIRALEQTPSGELFALSQFKLYRRKANAKALWQEIPIAYEDERVSDLTLKGDTLVVLARSHVFTATYPYQDFTKHELKAPNDYTDDASLFRTMWLLHSGELFGLLGKLFVDFLGLVLIFLCLTGLVYWFMPKYIKRWGKGKRWAKKTLSKSLSWHDLVGRKLLYLLLFLTITGWCLRPPLLIAIVRFSVPKVPFSHLDKPNPWSDKLRMIRYDHDLNKWLLSSSNGFYEFEDLEAIPQRIDQAPPVSVMGLNVWEQDKTNKNLYVIGSFQGAFLWDKKTRLSYDYDHKELVRDFSPIPFGKKAVSGYSADFSNAFYVDYNEGAETLMMPEMFRYMPMSLWHLALEVHTGRIYTFMGMAGLLFIFLAGLFTLWVLISGIKLKLRKKTKS